MGHHTSSRQSSAASRRSGYAKAAACSVCHVPHQSTVRRIEAVLRSRHGRQCHCCLCLTDPKKREVLLHLSREKKIEFQERIYNQHVRLLSSEPFGWFAPPKSTRVWEPTLLWNHYAQNPSMHYEKRPRFRRSRLGWAPPPRRAGPGGTDEKPTVPNASFAAVQNLHYHPDRNRNWVAHPFAFFAKGVGKPDPRK